MWGTTHITNYLPVPLWGLSYFFYALISMLNISHFTPRINARRRKKKEKTTFQVGKRSGALLPSRIPSTLSYSGIFIILSCRSPEEQIKASKT